MSTAGGEGGRNESGGAEEAGRASGFDYTAEARRLQSRFDTETLAGALLEVIVRDALDDGMADFVGSRDMFWLSSVDPDGMPTVSYKGGAPGVVAVLDSKTLAFPNYDGNGMYYSAGNIEATSKVGLLFMDFERPHRIRVQGNASLSDDAELVARWPGAQFAVRVEVTTCFQNCPRYIHRMKRTERSRYVPDATGQAPVPGWKRIDAIQPVLPSKDQGQAEAAGGLVTEDEYGRMLERGDPRA